jgi:hypothetical protein
MVHGNTLDRNYILTLRPKLSMYIIPIMFCTWHEESAEVIPPGHGTLLILVKLNLVLSIGHYTF